MSDVKKLEGGGKIVLSNTLKTPCRCPHLKCENAGMKQVGMVVRVQPTVQGIISSRDAPETSSSMLSLIAIMEGIVVMTCLAYSGEPLRISRVLLAEATVKKGSSSKVLHLHFQRPDLRTGLLQCTKQTAEENCGLRHPCMWFRR